MAKTVPDRLLLLRAFTSDSWLVILIVLAALSFCLIIIKILDKLNYDTGYTFNCSFFPFMIISIFGSSTPHRSCIQNHDIVGLDFFCFAFRILWWQFDQLLFSGTKSTIQNSIGWFIQVSNLDTHSYIWLWNPNPSNTWTSLIFGIIFNMKYVRVGWMKIRRFLNTIPTCKTTRIISSYQL